MCYADHGVTVFLINIGKKNNTAKGIVNITNGMDSNFLTLNFNKATFIPVP